MRWRYDWLQLLADSGAGASRARGELNGLALKLDSSELMRAQRLAAQFKAGDFVFPVLRQNVPGDSRFKLNSIAVSGRTPFAVINGKILAEGDSVRIPVEAPNVAGSSRMSITMINGKAHTTHDSAKSSKNEPGLMVKCLKVEKEAVTIVVEGEDAPRVLRVE